MRNTLGLTFVATVCAVTLGLAQTPSSSSSQTQAKGKTVTVSGCVQRATESGMSGTTGSGTAASSGAAAKFELTNATIAGGSSSSGTEATGTSGSAASKTYSLDGTDAQLAAHVNHKVEVTGTLQESASSGATSTEATGTTGSAKAAAPKLKVDSVKMVSASCTM